MFPAEKLGFVSYSFDKCGQLVRMTDLEVSQIRSQPQQEHRLLKNIDGLNKEIISTSIARPVRPSVPAIDILDNIVAKVRTQSIPVQNEIKNVLQSHNHATLAAKNPKVNLLGDALSRAKKSTHAPRSFCKFPCSLSWRTHAKEVYFGANCKASAVPELRGHLTVH